MGFYQCNSLRPPLTENTEDKNGIIMYIKLKYSKNVILVNEYLLRKLIVSENQVSICRWWAPIIWFKNFGKTPNLQSEMFMIKLFLLFY